MDAADLAGALTGVEECVRKAKTESHDPYILIGGDMNKHDFAPAVAPFPDIKEMMSPPTRGDARLDRVYSNLDEYIKDVTTHPPLSSNTGTDSDHKVLAFTADIAHRHAFKIHTRITQPLISEGRQHFKTELANTTDWKDYEGSTPTESALMLEGRLQSLMSICFPKKKITFKSTDDPWITQGIRKKIKLRKRIFRERGRNNDWKRLKRITDSIIKKAVL